MAQRKDLISIEMVTDCETGLYRIGELDYGISVIAMENYLKNYGHEGRKELLYMLGFLSHQVCEYFERIQKENLSQASEASK